MTDVHLDGNALVGALRSMLAFDPTIAETRCGACGDVARLAEARVFGWPMGAVARCRRCDNVLMVAVHRQGQDSLSLNGLSSLRAAR